MTDPMSADGPAVCPQSVRPSGKAPPPCRLAIRPRAELGETLALGVSGQHHFCFGGYQRSDRISWGALRGVNHYRLAPGCERAPVFHAGFEIVTLVLAGRWRRTGSLPAAMALSANAAELISTGIGCSLGASVSGGMDARVLELWVEANTVNAEPRRQWLGRRRTDLARPIATGAPPEPDALMWDTDARLHYGWLEAGERFRSRLDAGERGYLVVVDGVVAANALLAQAGDGLAAAGAGRLELEALERARIVWIRGL